MSFFRRKSENQKQQAKSGLSRTPSTRSIRSLPPTQDTPDSWNGEHETGVSTNGLNGSIPSEKRPKTLCLSETVLQKDGSGLQDQSLESPMRSSSRLSKTLLEVLVHKNALACLKAYLRSQSAEHLIQFWCDAESFHAATLTRRRTHKNSLHKRCSNSLLEKETQGGSNGGQDSRPDSLEAISHKEEVIHQSDKDSLSKSHQAANIEERIDSTSIDLSPNNLNSETNSSVSKCGDDNNSVSSHGALNETSSQDIVDIQGSKVDLSSNKHQPGSSNSIPVETSVKLVPSSSSQEDISTKLKKSIERDAVTIFSAYIAKDAPKPIGVEDIMREESISKICREDGEVDPECFANCQGFVLGKIDSQYFPGFRDSEHHCSHQAHVLTSERIYLPDVLLNENALCYFTEYMEQEEGSDLMQLWLAADNFQQHLVSQGEGGDPDQHQADAMVIYDRYFSLQATHPLGFDDKMRFEVESNICREEGPLSDCFSKAKAVVLTALDQTYFPTYIGSAVYHRYLSDLVSTVQMAEDGHNKPFVKGHKRTESDASSVASEHSMGSHNTGAVNTLLAVDTRRGRASSTLLGGGGQGATSGPDFSMTLDMFNPDLLWRRPTAGEMSLGSVNELGQFVSQFEQGTDTEKKKSTGFFKRRKEKEKEQEEMALKVAQMIINDVNTMTKTGETMKLSEQNS